MFLHKRCLKLLICGIMQIVFVCLLFFLNIKAPEEYVNGGLFQDYFRSEEKPHIKKVIKIFIFKTTCSK